jgi:hypothetical protein
MVNAENGQGRMWSVMLSSLHVCFGCRRVLRNSAATVDAFCRECVDRSIPTEGDELGGEA